MVVALAGAGFIAAAVNSETGSRLLWTVVSRLIPGVSGTFVEGTWLDGVKLTGVQYHDAHRRIDVDKLDASWQIAWKPAAWTVNFLRVGELTVALIPDNEKSLPPRQLVLPLAIDIRDFNIAALNLKRGDSITTIESIHVTAKSDRVRHEIHIERASTPWGAARTDIRVDGSGPVSIAVDARMNMRLVDEPMAIDARLTGVMEKLDVALTAQGAKFSARAGITATPFADLPFTRADVDIEHLNPQRFSPSLPRADLAVEARLVPTGDSAAALVVTGPVSLRNALAGALDKQLLPLISAQAEVRLDQRTQEFSGLRIALPGGARATGRGRWLNGGGELKIDVQALDLRALHTAMQKTRLNGPLEATQAAGIQHVALNLSGEPYTMSIVAKAAITPAAVALESATLRSGDARLEIKGRLSRDEQSRYELTGLLTQFDPGRFVAQSLAPARTRNDKTVKAAPLQRLPADIRINMDFSASGKLKPEFESQLRFAVHDSTYDRLPMSGKGFIALRGKRLLPSEAQLSVAGNVAELNGSFGEPRDSMRFRIDAPALDRLGVGATGRVQASGTLAGTFDHPLINAQWEAARLAFREYALDSASGEAQLDARNAATPDAKTNLTLKASGVRGGPVALTRLEANIDGTYATHRISLGAVGRLRGQPLDLRLNARGGLEKTSASAALFGTDTAWRGTLERFDNRGLPAFALERATQLYAGGNRVEIGATQISIERATVDLKELIWRAGLLRTAGQMRGLNIGHVLQLQQEVTGNVPPVTSTLVLTGAWDVNIAERASGFAEVKRESGDVSVKSDGREIVGGIESLQMRAAFEGSRMRIDGGLATARFGKVNAAGYVGLVQDNGFLTVSPQSTLALRIQANIAQLDNISSVTGARVALRGSANADLQVNGTLEKPVLAGNMIAENLELTLYDQGIKLNKGVARLAISNNKVELQEVVFHGGDGTLRATGTIPLDQTNPALTATIVADKLQLIADPSRQLTMSGTALAANTDGQLKISGEFTVDHALFDLPEKSAPKLDDDVVILGPGAKHARDKNAPRPPTGKPGLLPPVVDVKLGLGNDFRFRGAGAALLLAGTLNIKSGPGQPPQGFGTVRVVNGVYEAFGAKLTIEQGILAFQGPLDNPGLNIIAMRREREVEAGVQVTGNVRVPRIDLVSSPNLPEEEKLSWLVFGHGSSTTSGSGNQAQAAMQVAATGLLNKMGSSEVASGLGLNTLSLGASNTGALAGQQVVTIGKEISSKLSVGYEQSLAGIGGIVKLTYELSRNWSVAFLGGSSTGLDILYSNRFDSLGDRRRQRDGVSATE